MPDSLVERFTKVAKEVPQIPKEGYNVDGGYDYLRAVDVFDAVRLKLFEAGILIIPIGLKVTIDQPFFSLTGDITERAIVEHDWLIRGQGVEGGENIGAKSVGVGLSHDGKAVAIASTASEKDLLKRMLMLAGVKEDSEAIADTAQVDPGLAEKIAEMEKKFGTDSGEWTVDRVFVNAWCSAARKTGYQIPAQKAFLKNHFKVEKISDLKRKDKERAMDWAVGKWEIEGGSNDSLPEDE